MVPSFRLIAYYFDQRNKIIADSVWVDVRDECEINVKVSKQSTEIEVGPSEGKNKQNHEIAQYLVCLLMPGTNAYLIYCNQPLEGIY